MSVKTRALLIGMTGPAIQTIGFVWSIAHLLLHHAHGGLTARHIVFEPAVLVIAVGFVISVIAVPVALEVSHASLEEVAMPVVADEEGAGHQIWGTTK
jgi:hypothetical protein